MSGFGQVVALQPGQGNRFRIGTDEFAVKAASVNAEDGFSLIEYFGSAQPGPPLHLHRTFEECWFILDGEVDFVVDGRKTRGRSGSVLLVPRGVPHSFQVVGPGHAHWIGVFSPGKYMRLLEELGRVIPGDGPPDPREIQAVFSRFDTEIVPTGPTS